MANFIVIVKSAKNGRINGAFGMKTQGMSFHFQETDGKWVGANFALEEPQRIAFKVLFDEESKFLNEFLYSNRVTHTETKGKYTIIVREL